MCVIWFMDNMSHDQACLCLGTSSISKSGTPCLLTFRSFWTCWSIFAALCVWKILQQINVYPSYVMVLYREYYGGRDFILGQVSLHNPYCQRTRSGVTVPKHRELWYCSMPRVMHDIVHQLCDLYVISSSVRFSPEETIVYPQVGGARNFVGKEVQDLVQGPW